MLSIAGLCGGRAHPGPPFIAVQTDIPDIVSGTAYSICGLSFGLFLESCSNGCSRPPGAPSTPCSPWAPRVLGPSSTSSWTWCHLRPGALRMEVAGLPQPPSWADRGGRPGGAVQPPVTTISINPSGASRPNGPVIRNIYSWCAVLILNSIGSVDDLGMNGSQILPPSSTAVAVFNVYFGSSQGFCSCRCSPQQRHGAHRLPNNGARKRKRWWIR